MPILWCQLLDVCSNCSTENWSVPLMRASSHLQVWKPRLKYFCWIPARLHRSTVAFLPRASPCFPISFIQAILNNYFPEFKLTKTFFFFLKDLLCIYVGMHILQGEQVVIRGQLVEAGPLLPPCGFWGLNSGLAGMAAGDFTYFTFYWMVSGAFNPFLIFS